MIAKLKSYNEPNSLIVKDAIRLHRAGELLIARMAPKVDAKTSSGVGVLAKLAGQEDPDASDSDGSGDEPPMKVAKTSSSAPPPVRMAVYAAKDIVAPSLDRGVGVVTATAPPAHLPVYSNRPRISGDLGIIEKNLYLASYSQADQLKLYREHQELIITKALALSSTGRRSCVSDSLCTLQFHGE
jgi:hypothetical protein